MHELLRHPERAHKNSCMVQPTLRCRGGAVWVAARPGISFALFCFALLRFLMVLPSFALLRRVSLSFASLCFILVFLWYRSAPKPQYVRGLERIAKLLSTTRLMVEGGQALSRGDDIC